MNAVWAETNRPQPRFNGFGRRQTQNQENRFAYNKHEFCDYCDRRGRTVFRCRWKRWPPKEKPNADNKEPNGRKPASMEKKPPVVSTCSPVEQLTAEAPESTQITAPIVVSSHNNSAFWDISLEGVWSAIACPPRYRFRRKPHDKSHVGQPPRPTTASTELSAAKPTNSSPRIRQPCFQSKPVWSCSTATATSWNKCTRNPRRFPSLRKVESLRHHWTVDAARNGS